MLPTQNDDAHKRTHEQVRVLVLAYVGDFDLEQACKIYATIVSTNDGLELGELREENFGTYNAAIIGTGMVNNVCLACGWFSMDLGSHEKHSKCVLE